MDLLGLERHPGQAGGTWIEGVIVPGAPARGHITYLIQIMSNDPAGSTLRIQEDRDCPMSHKYSPVVNQWYWHHDKGQPFFVTDIDDEEHTVRVQHFDGDIEDYTCAEWRSLDIEPGAEPENWRGALEVTEVDDLGSEITDTSDADWDEPYQEVKGSTPADDDYGEGHMEEEATDVEQSESVADEPASLNRRPDGVIEETFSESWYAEYTSDEDSGQWRVEVFRRDVPEWRGEEFESLEDARIAATEIYSQASL